MIGDIISGVGSVIGGLFGDDDAKKNRQMQMDLAKNNIQYKVADAKKAGVHPLYALGAPSANFNPVSSPMGQSIQNASQSFGKAVSSNYEKQLQQKNLENIQADIDLKKARTMGFIGEYKDSSNVARAPQTGRTGGNDMDYVNPQATKNIPIGKGASITTDKNVADAQTLEDRYAEWANLFAPYIMYKDYKKTMDRKNPYGKDVEKKYPTNTGILPLNLYNAFKRWQRR